MSAHWAKAWLNFLDRKNKWPDMLTCNARSVVVTMSSSYRTVVIHVPCILSPCLILVHGNVSKSTQYVCVHAMGTGHSLYVCVNHAGYLTGSAMHICKWVNRLSVTGRFVVRARRCRASSFCDRVDWLSVHGWFTVRLHVTKLTGYPSVDGLQLERGGVELAQHLSALTVNCPWTDNHF